LKSVKSNWAGLRRMWRSKSHFFSSWLGFFETMFWFTCNVFFVEIYLLRNSTLERL
jgi:hypothetical protein